MNSIHSKITNNHEDITSEFINQIVNDYEAITDNINYSFPNKLKKTNIKTQKYCHDPYQ